MLKKILFLGSVLVALPASAATIQMGKGLQAGVNVQTSSGALVPGGYQILIGTFAVEPTGNLSLSDVIKSFSEFTRTTSPTSGASNGLITAADATSVSAVATAQTASLFNGKAIYFIIGDNAGDSTTWGNFGVIKGQTPSATSWTFPADTTSNDSVNAITANAGLFTAVIGSEIDNASGVDSFKLVAVPEPSVGLLSLLVGLGMVTRRKR